MRGSEATEPERAELASEGEVGGGGGGERVCMGGGVPLPR